MTSNSFEYDTSVALSVTMVKGNFALNFNLHSKYPFILKTVWNNNIPCDKCRIEFSVAHGDTVTLKNKSYGTNTDPQIIVNIPANDWQLFI